MTSSSNSIMDQLSLAIILGIGAFCIVVLLKRRKQQQEQARGNAPSSSATDLSNSENNSKSSGLIVVTGTNEFTTASSFSTPRRRATVDQLLPLIDIKQRGQQQQKNNVAPEFPFLKISNLVHQGLPPTFLPNTRESIPFDCETCSGEMIVMLRTTPLDPAFVWAFEKKKRYFELHFRLKFKVEPRGVVYLGGEIPKKMNLGLATDMACKGILAVVKRLSSSLHASFGDDTGDELPHIVFPLWHAADRLVVSKPSESLPEIGRGQIAESNESRSARFKDASLGRNVIRNGDTVTFSFHSAYMDLVEWKVRGLGAIRDQNLSLFWGTQPLRVVVYDVDSSTSKKHVRQTVRYYLCFELKNTWHERGEDEEYVLFNSPSNDDEETDDEDESEEPVTTATTTIAVTGSEKQPMQQKMNRSSSFKRLFKPQKILQSIIGVRSKSGLGMSPTPSPPTSPRNSNLQSQSFGEKSSNNNNRLYPLLVRALPTTTTTIRVPIWIRLRGGGTTGTNKTPHVCYVVVIGTTCHFLDFETCCRLFPSASWRSSKTLLSASSGSVGPSTIKSSPSSSTFARLCENRRAMLDEEASKSGGEVLLESDTGGDDIFVSSRPPLMASKRFVGPDVGKILFETLCLRQVFESHFQEEWLVLLRANSSRSVFALFFVPHKMKPIRIIPAASIFSCKIFSEDFFLEKKFPALEIAILSKVKLLCFPTKDSRARVYEILTSSEDDDSSFSRTNLLPETIPSAFSFALDTNAVVLDETYRWGPKKRVVLNNRRSVYALTAEEKVKVVASPNAYICQLLRTAVAISTASTTTVDEQIAFFDQVSLMRAFDLLDWTLKAAQAEEVKAFFLNLFHLILVHARLMVGPPSSAQGYDSFATQMSYEFGSGVVLSLAEVEHRILRPFFSSTTTGSSSGIPVPPSTRTTTLLALRDIDPRICFALNRLTLSCVSSVPVFDDFKVLDEKLSKISTQFLDEFLVVESNKRIKVPKVVDWYWTEFSDDSSSAKGAMGVCLKWLSSDKTAQLSQLVGGDTEEDVLLPHLATSGSNGQLKFEFRKFHWQPRTRFETC